MAKTLKDLLLALLNATLILVALCLFLGWKLASTVEGITSGFAENIQVVAPLREQAQGIRGELAALRSDLATIQIEGDSVDSATAQRLNAALNRLDGMEDKLQSTQARFADMAESPDTLIDQAITTTADVIADRIIAIRGCAPAS